MSVHTVQHRRRRRVHRVRNLLAHGKVVVFITRQTLKSSSIDTSASVIEDVAKVAENDALTERPEWFSRLLWEIADHCKWKIL